MRAADIVADLFKEKLLHTPLSGLGINYVAHFRVQNFQQQKALGRALAPIEPWGRWADELEGDTLEDVGGMINLTMQISKTTDRKFGNIKVVVQPSVKLVPTGTGVYVQINDHYDGGPEKLDLNFTELCLTQIIPSLERSRSIVSQLSDLARSM